MRSDQEQGIDSPPFSHNKDTNNIQTYTSMIKALFFDIDGTLVSFLSHHIPQSTVDAITEAKAKGIRIYIATGRPIQIIDNLSQIEHLVDGYVTTNGAYCFVDRNNQRQEITCHDIPTKDIQTMIDAASAWNASVIMVGTDNIAVYNYHDIVDEVFGKRIGVTAIDYSTPLEEVLAQPILQMTPFIDEQQEKLLMTSLSDCVSGRWCPDFTDITHFNADKGKGIEAMAKHEGLELSEIMAFGDGGNDLSMIKKAGIGVAMGNAGEELKAVADYITTAIDEDGIANALKAFNIIKK